jgi:hypothetical protein
MAGSEIAVDFIDGLRSGGLMQSVNVLGMVLAYQVLTSEKVGQDGILSHLSRAILLKVDNAGKRAKIAAILFTSLLRWLLSSQNKSRPRRKINH